jgi:hypothetical protein
LTRRAGAGRQQSWSCKGHFYPSAGIPRTANPLPLAAGLAEIQAAVRRCDRWQEMGAKLRLLCLLNQSLNGETLWERGITLSKQPMTCEISMISFMSAGEWPPPSQPPGS